MGVTSTGDTGDRSPVTFESLGTVPSKGPNIFSFFFCFAQKKNKPGALTILSGPNPKTFKMHLPRIELKDRRSKSGDPCDCEAPSLQGFQVLRGPYLCRVPSLGGKVGLKFVWLYLSWASYLV